jgi:hypothetical protein
MNKQPLFSEQPAQVMPLTLFEQSQIKGGMAATDEEKRKKVKKHR